jgi:hypothetical protein
MLRIAAVAVVEVVRALQVLENAVIVVRRLERVADEQADWILLGNTAH